MFDHSTAVFLMAEAPMEEVSFKVSFLYSGNKTTSLPPHRRNTKLRPLHHSGNKTTSLPPHRRNREFTQRRRRRQREWPKSNRFRQAKQQLCTCITLFFTFLCRRCTTTTWNCLISRFVEDGNTRQQLSFSFPKLWYSPLEFNSKKICQHLTN